MSLFVLNALFDVTHAVLQAAPEVTPASNPDGSPAGSPGIGGFFATALLSLLVVALGVDMTRRTRRLRYRAQYAATREAELAAASEHEGETPNEPAKAGEDTATVTKDEVARERH